MEAITNQHFNLKTPELVIDLAARRVWLNTQEVWLTPREFAVLLFLVRHTGRIVSDAELLKAVWGTDDVIGDTALRSVIKRLRRKIGDQAGQTGHIITVWGRGYRFEP